MVSANLGALWGRRGVLAAWTGWEAASRGWKDWKVSCLGCSAEKDSCLGGGTSGLAVKDWKDPLGREPGTWGWKSSTVWKSLEDGGRKTNGAAVGGAVLAGWVGGLVGGRVCLVGGLVGLVGGLVGLGEGLG